MSEGKPPRNRLIALIWMARPWNAIALDMMFCVVAATLTLARVPPLVPTALVILAASFIHSAGTVLNDYTDIEIDKKLFPDRPLALGMVKPSDALFFWATLSAIAVVIGWFLGLKVFGTMLLLWIFGILYSWVPRIKDIYILNDAFIGISHTFQIFSAAWAVGGQITPIVLLYALVLILIIFSGRSFRSFLDYEADMEYGKITLPVKLGLAKSSKLIALLWAIPPLISTSAYFLGDLNPIFFFIMIFLTIVTFYYSVELASDPSPENVRSLYEGPLNVRVPVIGWSIAFILGTLL